jgi:dienelactone hydrolase
VRAVNALRAPVCRGNHKEEAAEDAWQRCVAFFTKYLKA